MPVVISPQTKMAAYGVAALCTSALVAHYAMSLPDALERGREGVRRTREAPCLVLKPAPMNSVLGKLPQNLRAIGADPADIDIIMLTHGAFN